MQNVDWGELYDLDRDPGELENLWGHPNYITIKSQLLEALAQSELAAVDRSPAPTGRA